nr:MAG TPA: hypothetical protein [Caudoviricetes sp.]
MLTLHVKSSTLWDEVNERFVELKGTTLKLEHSLVSISKWESKWNKVFLSKEPKTDEEAIDYIRCMTLTQNVDPIVYQCLTKEDIERVDAYIDAPMTASTVKDESPKGVKNREQTTSELIYYWMICYQIPFECQKWHLNRLLMLINICNVKNAPPKKRSKRDLYQRNAAINAANKKKFNTKG